MTRAFELPGRSAVYATGGAAATSHPLATTAAVKILHDGGNAVDAAIAAVAVQCVVEPAMTGIGGDCFVIVGQADGTLHGLNGSGRAAAGAQLGWYLDQGIAEIASTSAHSITVPGAVKAWETLHQKFGSMDFARLFADAIHFAENGYGVGPKVGSDWLGLEEKLSLDEGASKIFLKAGKAPKVGDVMRNPGLATSLKRIAMEGADALYSGEIAAEISATVKAKGGFLEESDLAAVSADWVDLISTEYHGYHLHEIPPNGQGITALVLLNLLNALQNGETFGSPERAHLELECARMAYAMRDAEVADPAHMTQTVATLLSEAYTQALAEQFDVRRRNDALRVPPGPHSDTVYLTVVDRDLLSVSFINSLYEGFGSGITTASSGIALQNRGACFVVEAGHPNAIGPGKRPMHTIIPAMVTQNGRVTHSFGVMGGQYQPMGQAHVLTNMIDFGLDPQEALDDSRFFWNESGDIEVESGVSQLVFDGLKARGHPVLRGGIHGGGQVIAIDHERGVLCAGSDPRKDGHAAGL